MNGETARAVVKVLQAANPEALLMEPGADFDPALVGVTREPADHWPRKPGGPLVAVYCADRVIECLHQQGLTREGAIEYFAYNIAGGWLGEHTPTFRYEEGDDYGEE